MEPITILQKALGSDLVAEDGERVELELLPQATPAEVSELESRLPCKIPSGVRELLGFCRGFYGSAAAVVDFTGQECFFEQPELFPHGLPIAGDGFGNFWVADLGPTSTEWAPIFFACHDPPVVLYQSASLAGFLEDLLALSKSPHHSSVDDVHEDRLYRVWRTDPGIQSREQCATGSDPVLAAFAASLDDGWSIVDLRSPQVGFGFSWGRYGPRTMVRRHGSIPVFAYRRPPSRWRRLFGARR